MIRRQPELAVPLDALLVEAQVGAIEEQQVLTLHVEDQRLGVGRLRTEHPRSEHRVEQERGVGGLGRHAGHATDAHVRAARAVEKVDVRKQRLAVTSEADRESAIHRVEQERAVTFLADGAPHGCAGARRHERLGLHACGAHLGGFDGLRGQHTVGDEEDVRIEAGTFLAGPHLGDHTRKPHRLGVAGELTVGDDDVVELEILVRRDRHPERQRRAVLGPDHSPDELDLRLRHGPTVPITPGNPGYRPGTTSRAGWLTCPRGWRRRCPFRRSHRRSG